MAAPVPPPALVCGPRFEHVRNLALQQVIVWMVEQPPRTPATTQEAHLQVCAGDTAGRLCAVNRAKKDTSQKVRRWFDRASAMQFDIWEDLEERRMAGLEDPAPDSGDDLPLSWLMDAAQYAE